MQKKTDAQAIEFFHLVFLGVMQARVDQSRYVLKGGANLRYFFNSDRYSEDIDLDAIDIERWKLEEKVDAVIKSAAMTTQLERAGLVIEGVNKHKQTETTQRWKFTLTLRGRQTPLHTKIEFSRRQGDDGRRALEPVPDRVSRPHALRPPTVLHYSWVPALEQKIAALGRRAETQARDVFDIELLLRQGGERFPADEVKKDDVRAAIVRTMELPFEAFLNQVAPFLDPEVADQYDRASWEYIRSTVAEWLGGLR